MTNIRSDLTIGWLNPAPSVRACKLTRKQALLCVAAFLGVFFTCVWNSSINVSTSAVGGLIATSAPISELLLPRTTLCKEPVVEPVVDEGASLDLVFPAIVGGRVPGVAFGNLSAQSVIIFVGEWWGLDSTTLSYAAQAPFGGAFALNPYRDSMLPVDKDFNSVEQVSEAVNKAAQRMRGAHWRALVDDIQSIVHHVRRHGARSVGMVGWSFGGCLTLLSAQHVSGLDAAVAFHGSPDAQFTGAASLFQPSDVAVPTLLITGEHDQFTNFSGAVHFEELHGKISGSQFLIVDSVDHGFMANTSWWEAWKAAQTPPRPAFQAGPAALAWGRAMDFLKATLPPVGI